MTRRLSPPQAVGLYHPRYEHDACGVGMVARLDNQPTHEVIRRALTALENLEHRGAAGADPRTGDGAGILMQMPDAFLRATVPFSSPRPVTTGSSCASCRPIRRCARSSRICSSSTCASRDSTSSVGATSPSTRRTSVVYADASRPVIRQLFVGAGPGDCAADQDRFERKLYVIRRICELAAGPDLYICSSSSRTINYKGMLISFQLAGFYPDLADERLASAVGLVHSRFSTNTFPSWSLAHPYRVICHNGEINTLMGNVNWMRARESELASALFGLDLQKILPVVSPGSSDSATFDNVLELLLLAGRSLPHAMMMMIPQAYRGRDDLPEELKGFYAYHACLMEPWDGPAAVAFTDGRLIGATLDRNGLRPGRWVLTSDGHVVLGSEAGLLGIPTREVQRLGRLAPGNALPDRPGAGPDRRGRRDEAADLTQRPYGEWFASHSVHFRDLPPLGRGHALRPAADEAPAGVRLHAGGPARAARARWRATARSRSARWATTSRSPSSPTRPRRCSPTSSSCSRRSPTRRSTRSARRS